MKLAQLAYYDDAGSIRLFRSSDFPILVGSAAECALRIDGLAPRECEIFLAADGYYATDLSGQLGVGDRAGSGYLRDGDTLSLGGWLWLRFNLVDEAEVPAAAPRPRGARSEPHPPVPGSNHRPGLALLLAVLLPGSGQAYNGQPFKGALLLLTTVLVLPWVYSLFDARAVARQIAADGPRIGRGGLAWVALHGWLFLNLTLLTLIVLTLKEVLQ